MLFIKSEFEVEYRLSLLGAEKHSKQTARVVELVDTLVLEASGEIHESSSLSFRTKISKGLS